MGGTTVMSVLGKIGRRMQTTLQLLRYFASPQRWFLLPLLVVLLLGGLLLLVTGGMSYVAPFVYTLF
jgi:hypothetical protein